MAISDTDSKDGAIYAAKNARVLLESAEKIHQAGTIGCATALLVLSIEEFSKAFGLGLKHDSFLKKEDLKALFRNHAFKHDKASHTVTILLSIIGLTQEPNEHACTGQCDILDHIDTWNLNADDLKKRGFYVDYNNGEWLTPDSVTESDYQLSLYIANILQAVSEVLLLNGKLDDIDAAGPRIGGGSKV